MNADESDHQLVRENRELRNRLEEAEETLRAIRSGDVDAFVITQNERNEVFTLETADRPYRLFVEAMQEGAVTLDTQGTILFCNDYFCQLIDVPADGLRGSTFRDFVLPEDRSLFDELLTTGHGTISLCTPRGKCVTVRLVVNVIDADAAPTICILLTDLTVQRNYDELKQAQQALQNAQERQDAILKATRNIIWISDAAGTFTKRQRSWEDYTGQGWPAHQGHGWLQAIHPDDREEVMRLWRQAVHEQSMYHSSGRLWCRHYETYRKFRAEAVPVRDAAGSVREWVGTIEDIHEKYLSELALQNAHTQIQTILESLTEGFVMLDKDWRYCYVNRAATDMLGTAVDAMMGRSLWEVYPEVRGSLFEEQFRKAVDSGQPVYFEARLDSTKTWYVCRCFPSQEGLSVFFDDVSEKMATLDRLRLTESEARRLTAVVENCSDFIGLATPDGKAIYVNEAGRHMVGLQPDADVSETHILDYIAPESLATMKDVAIPAVERDGRWKGSVSFRNFRSEASIPTLWNAFSIKDPDGGEMEEVWATISPDLTEQKRLEDTLRESELRAHQANRAKSEFLANMSHEIRTPMTAILGHADVLLAHLKDADDRSCVLTIKRNGNHLLELINDILDISRIEAGKADIELRRCDLNELLSDIWTLMHVRADKKRIDLRITAGSRFPATLLTDPKRLKQVLLNLVGNAIKFTDTGHVEVRISCSQHDAESSVEFAVEDTGIGIPEEHMTKLFEPFSQGDSSVTRKFGGTGLGLSISKRLVTMLGGELTVTSAVGQGSIFRVTLPADQDSDKLVGLSLDETLQEVTSPKATGDVPCRVLLVDDRRDVRHIALHFLEEAGARVATAKNGKEAVDAVTQPTADQPPFDVIVMDMQMPVMDGYTATKELRQRNCKIPIIALTADAMQGDRERCLAAGCNDYLSKPIDPSGLIEKVRRLTQSMSSEED